LSASQTDGDRLAFLFVEISGCAKGSSKRIMGDLAALLHTGDHLQGPGHLGAHRDGDESDLDHIVAIGEASSTLGLLATLVMAIALDKLLVSEKAPAHLLLVIGNGFSVYTVTYSILEWYYVKALLAARSREKEKKRKENKQADPSPSKLENGPAPDSAREYTSLEDEDFSELITPKFASMNRMRASCRNSMWMSLICILSAVSIFSSHSFKIIAGEEDSLAALIILVWMDIILSLWYYFFNDALYTYLLMMFGVLTVPCAVDALYLKSGFPMTTVLIDVFIVVEMFIVPRTVKIFRATFVEIIKSRTEAF
jgi:hypothetical protein